MASVPTRRKLSVLIHETVQDMNRRTSMRAVYIGKRLADVNKKRQELVDFQVYAQTLTDRVYPFTFTKAPSSYFYDSGTLVTHKKPISSQGKMGALDYYAASLVDPTFQSLCEEKARLDEFVRVYQRQRQKTVLVPGETQKADTASLPELDYKGKNIFTRVLDYFAGSNQTELPPELAGQQERLLNNLGHYYQNIIRTGGHKAAAIKEIAALIDKEIRDHKEANPENVTRKALRKISEGGTQAEDLNAQDVVAKTFLLKLAYLKKLGFEYVPVPVGSTIQAEVDKLVSGGQDKSGHHATPFQGLSVKVKDELRDAAYQVQMPRPQCNLVANLPGVSGENVEKKLTELDTRIATIKLEHNLG